MSSYGSNSGDRRRDPPRRRILYVTGLDPDTRAKDVGREFERCGPLVRCDIPHPVSGGGSRSRSIFAFVEFDDWRDAQDAYETMHNRRTPFGRLQVEWARRPPSRLWREEEQRGGSRRPAARSRSRSISRSRSPINRSRSPANRSPSNNRSRSPVSRKSISPVRSVSPDARHHQSDQE